MKKLMFCAVGAAALALAPFHLLTLATAAEKIETAAPGVIAAALQPYLDDHTLAGAVTLVASKDKVLDIETIGYADIAAKKPMRPDTLFWIASMSKPITASALMMLVDEGKVKVEDPVEKYLPEFKDQWLQVERDSEHMLLKKPVHPITVKNVLTHTSGMPATSPMEKPTLDMFHLRDAVHSYAINPLVFEPDSKYQYANSGINTAGRIIEVVGGMPYEQFLQTRIFTPLAMKDTTFRPSARQVQRLAKSYKAAKDKQDLEETTITQLNYPLEDRTRQPMPAGGLFSTAHDLGRFCQMVLNGGTFEGKRYLSEAAVRQMTSVETGEIKINDAGGYGFGWSVLKRAAEDGRGTGSFGHGGAYKTAMWVEPQKGLVMVLLRHYAGAATQEVNKIEGVFLKAALGKYGK